jgi:hypothetical protein
MSQGSVPAEDYPRLGRGSLAFVHFCQASDPTSRDPRRFVAGLSTTLAQFYQPFARALIETPSRQIVVNQSVGRAEPGTRVTGIRVDTVEVGKLPANVVFDEAVRKPLERLCDSDFEGTIVILVDSLDEAWGYDPEDNIATMLGQATGLPRQVRFLLTTRVDEEVLHAVPVPRLDLIADAPHQQDLLSFAYDRLEAFPDPRRTALARRVADAAAGDFLYARHVLGALPPGINEMEDLSTLPLPKDLKDIYRQFLQHTLGRTLKQWGQYRPLLGVVAVARALGLTCSQLAGIMDNLKGLSEDETSDFLLACSQYLDGKQPEGPFRIYHQSFQDFLLKDETYQVFPAQANQAVAEYFVATYGEDWPACRDDYALRYTEDHLEEVLEHLGLPEQRLARRKVERGLAALRSDRGYRLAQSVRSGRAWLLRAVNAWLAADSRVLLITGEPGSGKTALARQLEQISEGETSVDAHSYPYLGPGFLAYTHFCQARRFPTVDSLSFVQALSVELATRYSAFAEALVNTLDQRFTLVAEQNVRTAASGGQVLGVHVQKVDIGGLSTRAALERAVRRPLEELYAAGLSEPVVLLVDGLDEALTVPDPDNLVDLLGDLHIWPSQVRFLITSRLDPRILRLFAERAWHLDLVADAPSTIVHDVAGYVYGRLNELNLPGPERIDVAYRLARASEGNFLYAGLCADALVSGQVTVDQLEQPPGLDGRYREFLSREVGRSIDRWDERYRPLLGLLAVARDPGFTARQLAAIARLGLSVTRDTLRVCAQFLAGRWPDGPFRLFHASFRDWLSDRNNLDYHTYPAEAHRDISAFYLEEYRGHWDQADDYALQYVPSHLMQAIAQYEELGRVRRRQLLDDLAALLTDPSFLEAKARRFGADTVQADLQAAASLPALADEVRDRLRAAAADMATSPGRLAGSRTDIGEPYD